MIDLSELKSFFVMPFDGPVRITARFGDTQSSTEHMVPWGVGGHKGVDFSLPEGTPIKAMTAGIVVESGALTDAQGKSVGVYGNRMAIDHDPPEGFLPAGWKIRTWYCHLKSCGFPIGEWVEQGQIMAMSGNTGSSTGPHLHLMVQIVPPLSPGLNERLRGVCDPLQALDVKKPA